MIPIRLSIEGLYSYQKKQSIDFERLKAAELFGIFGSTGSGKSSILEAITFALYGRTERLTTREPGGTGYHMMNLKSNRLWIDFEFMSGNGEEEHYRITVESKRNRKHFDKTQPFSRKMYKWKADEWSPVKETDAETIIGLSYDNFKRTIIIPQGKFQDFIQLKSTERSQMLQDIFGLGKYELSRQVKTLVRQNLQKIETNQALLGQYVAVNKDVIKAEKLGVEELLIEQKKLNKILQALQKKREKQEQLRETFEKIAAFRQKLALLINQKPEIEKKEDQLNRYIICLDQFKSLLDKQTENLQQLKEIEDSLSQNKDTYSTLSEEVNKLGNTFESVEESYRDRDKILQEAEDYEKLLKLKALATHLVNLRERTEKGEKETKALEEQIEDKSVELEKLAQEIKDLRNQLPDTQELLAIEQWYAKYHSLREQLAWREDHLEKNRIKIQAAKKEKLDWLAKTDLDRRQYNLPTEKILQLIHSEIVQHENQQIQLREDQQQILLKAQLQSLADTLEEGSPCPLCGSVSHPAILHKEATDKELQQIQKKIRHFEQKVRQLQQVLPGLEQLSLRARELGSEQSEQKKEHQLIQTSLEKHLASFVWNAYDPQNEDAFKATIGKVQEVQAKITHKEQQINGLKTLIHENRRKVPHYRNKLEQYKMEFSTKQGEFQSSRQNLQNITYEEHAHKNDQEIHQKIAELKDAYQQLETTYQLVTNQLKEKKDRVNILKGKIEAESKQQQITSRQLAKLQQEIASELAVTDFVSLEEVKNTLNLSLNIQAEESFIKTFRANYTETQTTLKELEHQTKGQDFDHQMFEELVTAIYEKDEALSKLNQEIGGKREYIKRLQNELEQKKIYQKELKRLDLRADNLKVLDSLFRGNGFVNYVSTVYLENLCAAANQRFMKLTRNALTLEVDEQNNFHVRDLLNGGKQRSIKTLSGGQMFQAALCLALALSDQVQQQAQAQQNFFFLDEGFGSLDSDSLQLIFQTLKALQKENRIVGIISHVEELQQEIQTYLHIHNDTELGSEVVGSWE